MGLFSRADSATGTALIEISSGAVIISLAAVDETSVPKLIWSTKEEALLTRTKTAEESIKQMMSALLTAMMRVGQGAKKLREETGLHIEEVKLVIGAPWSYTISKEISYSEPTAFTVTKDLVHNLTQAALKKINDELVEGHKAELHNLTNLSRETTSYVLNGYPVQHPFGLRGDSIILNEMSTFADTNLYHNALELIQKTLPRAAILPTTSVVTLYASANQLFPGSRDYCLVDITHETTEIAIIRNQVLRYATFMPAGLRTLSRSLGKQLNIPAGEADALLREPYFTTAKERMNKAEVATVTKMLSEYETALCTLFHETGDSLSIPKVIFLHGHNASELFLKSLVTNAAKAATNLTHTVYEVTDHILETQYDVATRDTIKKQIVDESELMLLLYARLMATHRN